VTYKQLRAQDGRPIGKDEFVDEEANKHLYAPRDTKTITFQKKENAFGLGYAPGQGLNDTMQGRNGQNAQSGPNLSGGLVL
jgi:G patch domain-containing protein 1